MNMNAVTLNLLKSSEDEELVIIKENYSKPEVERFVSIDKDKFWQYVTEAENVYFYKNANAILKPFLLFRSTSLIDCQTLS